VKKTAAAAKAAVRKIRVFKRSTGTVLTGSNFCPILWKTSGNDKVARVTFFGGHVMMAKKRTLAAGSRWNANQEKDCPMPTRHGIGFEITGELPWRL
jgi:hypothetical protein